MKTKLLLRYALGNAFFILWLLGVPLSTFGQCPTITTPNPASICDASGLTINHLTTFATDTGGGIVWYDALTGGNVIDTDALLTEGTFYADADDMSVACVVRPSITISFTVPPTGQDLDAIFCSNVNPTYQTYIDGLAPNIPSGGSVEVYSDAMLTTLVDPLAAIPGFAESYIVFVDSGGCRSQIELAEIVVITAPNDPTPTDPQEFCSDTNPTIADLDPGTTEINFNWYDNSTASGSPLALTNALSDGTTYYIQVEGLLSFCPSNVIPVTVNISDPVDAGTSADTGYCIDSLPPLDFDLFSLLTGSPDTTGTWTGPLATTNGNLGTVNISTITTPNIYTFTYTVAAVGACPQMQSTVDITIYDSFTSGIANTPAIFCEMDLPTNFDLFTLLDNEDLGGQWTQGTLSTDPAVTSPIDLTSLAPGVIYNFTYTQNALPNLCTEESTTVQVQVLDDPEAGIAINQTFCENDLLGNSPFNLFDALDGSQDNNSGIWTDSNSVTVSSPIDITGLTVTGSPYTYTYTISNGTCDDTETISITIDDAPDSGTAVSTFPEFCQNDASAIVDLFGLLTGEDTNGTWYEGTDTSGTVVLTPNTVDLTSASAQVYNYTYSVPDIGICSDTDITVQVTINPLPNTGTPILSVFCENELAGNSPLNLFDQLTGEDAGGTWTDDDGTGVLTGSDVDLTALAIGSYDFSYSITDANNCSNSSTVTVTIADAPDSGTAVSTFPEFCQNDASAIVDLFNLITGEDTNGTWYEGTDTSGTVVLTPNIVDLTSVSAQVYNYTYSIPDIGTCSDTDITVQVIINPLPNTGTSTPAVFCENNLVGNSPLNLFDQLTGEDAGGTWTDDDATGVLTGSDVDLTALAIGSYDFSYSITDANNCSNSSTVTVTISDAPESGTVNTPEAFCIVDITTGQTYDLFDLLTGEEQTGVWTDDDTTGALTGSIVTLDGLAANTYNFTYNIDAIGICDDADVTVQIIINDTPAPTASASQEFCDAATIIDLVATGNIIQWYDDTIGGTALANTTDLVNGETYYASQTNATTGCESSVRTEVVVTINQSPNSGNPNTTAILTCNDNNNIDLFSGLDGSQDLGGIWSDDDSTGTLTGNVFDATGISAGTYSFTYTVVASTPCINDSTTIMVTIEAPLNSGTDNTLDVCSNSGTTDLFSLLGTADTGGTWSPALTSGTGVFDPLVDAQGAYEYSLTNVCGTFTSEIVVSVTQAPNAGSDNSVSLCVIDGVTDLFTSLGTSAQSGGTWSPALASGTGEFDPAIDTDGVYTYTVFAVSPCTTDASAQITVTVNDSSAPIVINGTPEFCLVNNPTVANLNDNLTITGTTNWYDDAALTIPLNASDALIDGEDYYATQTNSSGCESSINIQVTATVNDTPTPTLIDLNQGLCINEGPTINDLTLNITEYDVLLDNIVWYDELTNGSVVTSTTILSNDQTYYAALIDAVTGCESSIRLEVTPDLTSCGDIVLPDGFSPNGDGVNDTYDYDNVDVLYPNFEIEIYNRYGNIVYKGNASTPRFDGVSNQERTIIKGDLPVGVYFYIFRFNDGETETVQGRLYLSR